MNLEEGMHCYDKCNRKLGIGKILTEPSKHNNVGIRYKNGFAPVVSVGNVVASHNIIDLIEVGDYVNGFKVYDYLGRLVLSEPFTELHTYIDRIKIKSIVTKEMYESMQYEVK